MLTYIYYMGMVASKAGYAYINIMGGDLQPGCLTDRLLNGLGQLQVHP
jgi:hypothetical protein